MKITILTPVHNSENFLKSCINSIKNQTHENIEHIIIYKKSNDKTKKILQKYSKDKAIRIIPQNNSGIYNAINIGIKNSTGEIIAVLNSDDIYTNKQVLENINKIFKTKNPDILYADLKYRDKKSNKIVRKWKSKQFKKSKLKTGWMPPHPTLFIKSNILKKSKYNETLSISSDYEKCLSLFSKNYKIHYLPKTLVLMRTGGKSNQRLFNLLKKSKQDYKALRINNYNPVSSIIITTLKKLRKIPQYFI